MQQQQPANLIPVYQNGVITWAPARQTFQAPIVGQGAMAQQPMMQQNSPAMDHLAFQKQPMAMGQGAMPNTAYMPHINGNQMRLMQPSGMPHGPQMVPLADTYGQGMTGAHGSPMQYSAALSQQMPAMNGRGLEQYGNYMGADAALPHSSAPPGSTMLRSPRSSGMANMMDNSGMHQVSENITHDADALHEFTVAVSQREHQRSQTMLQPGPRGGMVHNPRMGAPMNPVYMHGSHNMPAMGFQMPPEMLQRMHPMSAHNVNMQRMQMMNHCVARQTQMGMYVSPNQQMGMPPSPYQVAQQLDRGNHNQAPNAAHIMQGQGSFSSSVIVPAQPQSLAGNGQAMNRRADIATMASIVSPKAVPNHCDQRMMQNGNVPCRPNVAGVSPRTVQGNQVIKRVFDGDDSMNNVKKIMLHHDAMNPRTPVAPSIKRTIFTISKNWKLRLPEQMVFFEFNISGESYKQIQSIISHLHQQTAVHETSKKDTQMFGRKDLQVLMQDKLEIAQASISDAVVFNIMDKLRCLKIALVKKGERQKLLRRHYPDRNCVVLTNFKKHELHCFFGYTTIDNKIKLALYHRTKCDDNPNFICGKETHQFKAVVERQYDLFLQVPGHGIQIILRRLADAHDKSFQVAFGAKSHDVVDLIMYVFNNPLADHQGVPMTSNTMS